MSYNLPINAPMQSYLSVYFVVNGVFSEKLKPVLARWMLLWLRARKLPRMSDDEVTQFLLHGTHAPADVLKKVHTVLGDDHVKMLNLCFDWLQSYLPFVLQKVNRVHYGLLHPADIAQLNAEGVKIPTSRKLTAVPFGMSYYYTLYTLHT